MTKPGQIEYRDVKIPSVGDTQILLQIKRIGVCGSDIHVYHGLHPYTKYPVVQGHEVSAVVIEIGRKVKNVKVGDIVTVQPQLVCGKCYPCTHGMYNDCETLKVMGFQTGGMASEFFVCESDKALKIPTNINLDYVAMVEPMAVAVHAIRRHGEVKGEKVLVLGGGPIGNLIAQTARAMGAQKVLLSELSTYRLEIAKKCGINTINPSVEKLPHVIMEIFGKDGADVIFDCVGINDTINQAINCARKGSDIVVVGVFSDNAIINMGFVQDHELRLIGTAMYRVEDFKKAIDFLINNEIELRALITHRIAFKDYIEAYHTVDSQKDKTMKIIIDFDISETNNSQNEMS